MAPKVEITQFTSTFTVAQEFRANFEIYTNGTKRDFSDSKYHNRSAEAYIEGSNPTVVVVKKTGITWQEFFDTLPGPFKISKDCLYTGTGQTFCSTATKKLTFTLNGQVAPDALSVPIKSEDKLVIRYE